MYEERQVYTKYINKKLWENALGSDAPQTELHFFFQQYHKNKDELKMAIDNVDLKYFQSLFKCCLETIYLLCKSPLNPASLSFYYTQQILSSNNFQSLLNKELKIIVQKYENKDWRKDDPNQDRNFFNYLIRFFEYYLLLSRDNIMSFAKLVDDTILRIHKQSGQFSDESQRMYNVLNKISNYPQQSRNQIPQQVSQIQASQIPAPQNYPNSKKSYINDSPYVIKQSPAPPESINIPQQRPQQIQSKVQSQDTLYVVKPNTSSTFNNQQNIQQQVPYQPKTNQVESPYVMKPTSQQQTASKPLKNYHSTSKYVNTSYEIKNDMTKSQQQSEIFQQKSSTSSSNIQYSYSKVDNQQIPPTQSSNNQFNYQYNYDYQDDSSSNSSKSPYQPDFQQKSIPSQQQTQRTQIQVQQQLQQPQNQPQQQPQYRSQNQPQSQTQQSPQQQQLYQQQQQPQQNQNLPQQSNNNNRYDLAQIFSQKKSQNGSILQMKDVKESYKHCPIEPSIQEFTNNLDREYVFGGAIFPISEKQPYSSVQLFLNNHFFILREDYMKDFRRAVQKLQINGFEDVGTTVIQNLFLYSDALIENMLVTNRGFQFAVSMTAYDPRNREINWRKTKRLMPGSLLLLSTTKLELMIFGTVVQKPENARKNRVSIAVQIVGIPIKDQLNHINLLLNQKEQLIVIENQVYFETYTHFLKCIQQIDDTSYPFKDQIIFASKTMPLPGYLDTKIIQQQGINYDIDLKFDLHKRSEIGKISKINILREWPTINSESLDSSQLKAVKIMLKNGISLIQGPPGTGKTFCGALGVRILLQNQFRWNQHFDRGRNKPILIVCQTNHALDQFLMHILTFCKKDDIVRIGGRCKIPEFEEMLLQTSKEQRKVRFPWPTYLDLRDDLDKKLRNLLNFVDNIHINDVREFLPDLKNMIVKEYLSTVDIQFEKQLSPESEKMIVHMWLDSFRPQEEQLLRIIDIEMRNLNKLIRNQENQKKFKAILKLNISDLQQTFVQLSQKAQQKLKENEYDGVDENDQIDSDEEENRKILNAGNEDHKNEFVTKLIKDQKSIKRLLNRLGRENEISFNELMKTFADPNFSIWGLPQTKRNIVSRYIFSLKFQRLSAQVQESIEEYEYYINRLNNAYIERDLDYIQNKKIVGVTLAGCAKYAEKLSNLDCNIMIVEEAGEVLESNLIAVLSKNINHLILIGDHQQLRPSLHSYDLEVKFRANISLFERLVKNGLEYATLTYQRRMKSSFADFIRLIYEDYRDHEQIQAQNKIKVNGLKHDILFYNHNQMENSDQFSCSKSNMHESQMIIKLSEYLIKNGTKQGQITILTTYIKQALYIQKQLQGSKIKVQTIDNYQGEENDIILLSLVRSNRQMRLGFVAIDNRICVALSRARLALYVFGNFNFIEDCIYQELNQPLLKKTSNVTDLWLRIIDMAAEKQILLNHIPLECASHNTITKIYNEDDWRKVKNGGCDRICDIKFPCGHICKDRCHVFDHKQQNCYQMCEKQLNCGHQCQNWCKVIPCPPCKYIVEKELPICKHKSRVQCSENINKIACKERCSKIAQCGHRCSLQCRDDCKNNRCQEMIEVTIVECKHVIKIKCDDQKYIEKMLCTQPCNKKLQCGHQCSGTCGTCLERFHSPCYKKCDKILYCGHKCQLNCGVTCFQCKEKCEVICNCNIRCSNICQKQCKKCQQQCKLRCEHSQCNKLCFEICDRKPCDKKCTKKLQCGCECLGLCGELCPSICWDESHTLNEITAKNQTFYQLECQGHHIFEVDLLDQYFSTTSVKQLIRCPKCQDVIWKSSRYQSYIKQSLIYYNSFKQQKQQSVEVDDEKLEELSDLVEQQLKFLKEEKLKDANSFLDNIQKRLKQEELRLQDQYDSNIKFPEYECLLKQLAFYQKTISLQGKQFDNRQFQIQKTVLINHYLLNEDFQQYSSSSFWWKIEQKLETLLLYSDLVYEYQQKKDNQIKSILFEIEDSAFLLDETKREEYIEWLSKQN